MVKGEERGRSEREIKRERGGGGGGGGKEEIVYTHLCQYILIGWVVCSKPCTCRNVNNVIGVFLVQ